MGAIDAGELRRRLQNLNDGLLAVAQQVYDDSRGTRAANELIEQARGLRNAILIVDEMDS